MRTIQALVIFLVFVGLVFVGGLYVKDYFLPEEERLDYISLGKKSQWFSGVGGVACGTSFVCQKNGARLHGMYLDQGDWRFRLQQYYPEVNRDFMDVNGNTPKGTKFDICEGGDNGVSLSLEQLEEYKPGIEVATMHVGAGDNSELDVYEYVIPKGYDRMKDGEVTLVFEATIHGIKQVYEQQNLIKGCLE